jgi:hypothetical protein
LDDESEDEVEFDLADNNAVAVADSEPAPTAEITPSPDAEHVNKAEVNADGAGSELH